MMVNGLTIRKMVMVNTSIWIKPNIMENGKKISEKAMELTTTQMVIDMREIGTMTFNLVLVHTTTPMEIFTKANG